MCKVHNQITEKERMIMTIYSYTRLDGERAVIDTGVEPLLIDVTNWFEDPDPDSVRTCDGERQ